MLSYSKMKKGERVVVMVSQPCCYYEDPRGTIRHVYVHSGTSLSADGTESFYVYSDKNYKEGDVLVVEVVAENRGENPLFREVEDE